MELKKPATYAGISMGKSSAHLNTKSVKQSNPEWNDVLMFRNFRCDHGKIATVTVYDSSFDSKNTIVGITELVLPVKFNEIAKHIPWISLMKKVIFQVLL